MADEPEVCTGLLGPCSDPVTHHLEDPDGVRPPIPMCDKHWDLSIRLEEALLSDPELRRRFEKEVNKAYKSMIPTRYERKPVI
jgi:hypothetical protein